MENKWCNEDIRKVLSLKKGVAIVLLLGKRKVRLLH